MWFAGDAERDRLNLRCRGHAQHLSATMTLPISALNGPLKVRASLYEPTRRFLGNIFGPVNAGDSLDARDTIPI